MNRLAIYLALTLLALPTAALAEDTPRPVSSAPVPHFVEEAAKAGVDHTYDGAWEFFVGGGVAIFDCNGDRRPDLFIAGGKNPAQLYENRSPTGGALAFKARDIGLTDRQTTKVLGAYPLDFDNDGLVDLAVLRLGENLLLKGKGDCRFEEANRALAFDGGREWTTGFSAVWEQGQSFPTLAFGNYVDRSKPGSPWGTCHDNFLFRPQGEGQLRYDEATRLTPGYCALSMLFTDWNRSGEPSLRISNDRQYYRGGEEQLWAVPPGRPPRAYRRADGWRHLKIWGMGIASIDLNSDGYPEYALTSMGDTKLQMLDDEADETVPIYRDIAFDLGATAHRPYTGDDLRPSDRLALGIPGREQRHSVGPVYRQRQCGGHAGFCRLRSGRPSARPMGREIRRSGRHRRDRAQPARPGRGTCRFQYGRSPGSVSWSTGRDRSACSGTSAPERPKSHAPWATGLRSRSDRTGTSRTALGSARKSA